jgi:hypothetical protein
MLIPISLIMKARQDEKYARWKKEDADNVLRWFKKMHGR